MHNFIVFMLILWYNDIIPNSLEGYRMRIEERFPLEFTLSAELLFRKKQNSDGTIYVLHTLEDLQITINLVISSDETVEIIWVYGPSSRYDPCFYRNFGAIEGKFRRNPDGGGTIFLELKENEE